MCAKELKALLLNDTRVDRHHGCSIVVRRIYQLAAKHGISIALNVPSRVDWRKSANLREDIASAELILVNGEGTIHHDAIAAQPLLAVAAEAKAQGKPAFLINTTWHANGSAFQAMARQFDIVSVREGRSQAELLKAGIESRVIPDLSLLTEFPRPSALSGIAYTDCVVPETAADLAQKMWPLKAQPLSILYGRRSPKEMRRAFNRARRSENGDKVDVLARGRITLDALRGQYDSTDVFLKRLAEYRIVVTGRFHVMMLCMALRVPFLVVASNTHKNLSALRSSGLGIWRHVEISGVLPGVIDRAQHWEPEEIAALEEYIAAARISANALFRDIALRSTPS